MDKVNPDKCLEHSWSFWQYMPRRLGAKRSHSEYVTQTVMVRENMNLLWSLWKDLICQGFYNFISLRFIRFTVPFWTCKISSYEAHMFLGCVHFLRTFFFRGPRYHAGPKFLLCHFKFTFDIVCFGKRSLIAFHRRYCTPPNTSSCSIPQHMLRSFTFFRTALLPFLAFSTFEDVCNGWVRNESLVCSSASTGTSVWIEKSLFLMTGNCMLKLRLWFVDPVDALFCR